MNTNPAFLFGDSIAAEQAAPGVTRKILGYDPTLMTVEVTFAAGAEGAPHTHPHAQTSYVASGLFEVTIGGETRRLKSGDGYYVAPHVVHGCLCLEAGVLIDNFSPCRTDFLPDNER